MCWVSRIGYAGGLSLFVICCIQIDIHGQTPPDKYAAEARLLKKTLEEKHVQPRLIDNEYSEWVFDNTLDALDPDRVCFTKEELNSLLVFRDKIDTELNGIGWNFLPKLTELYLKSLQRYSTSIKEISTQPIDFSTEAFFTEDSVWSDNVNALRKRWALMFRYYLQDRFEDLGAGAKLEKSFLAKNENAARQLVLRVLLRDADRILNYSEGFDAYVASAFLGSMAAAFDPHSAYFTSRQMQNFMTSLSTQGYYFGFTIDESEKGEFTVSQLMPGGPAWNSGEVHKGDVFQAIRWEGKEKEDLWGVDMDELNDMLDDPNRAKMELTVKKPDGSTKTVPLKKEKVTSEENMVNSFVLDGEKRIGFISLPDFYTDWQDTEGSKCASDVAREIVKLKREGIDGLILDIRFNGGGSMPEAIALAGIFIDGGPVGVVRSREGEPQTLKDVNRGTIYDGPLVIMVNSLSASASELLAAALQDYNRAIVVGTKTYGKATVQEVMSSNPAIKLDDKNFGQLFKSGSGGFAKITTAKLYRITGKAAQQNGIIPDIEIPDILDHFQMRESSLAFSLKPDRIHKKVYYQPLDTLPRHDLRKKSKGRIDAQPVFNSLRKVGAEFVADKFETDSVSLKWTDFQKKDATYNQLISEIVTGSTNATKAFKAELMKDEQLRAQSDSYYNEFKTSWIENLEKDITLNEAFLITCDFISHVTKNK